MGNENIDGSAYKKKKMLANTGHGSAYLSR